MHNEEDVWKSVHPSDLWALDKMILARTMGYIAGPVGVPVPFEDDYMVRPCVNPIGLGLGAQKVHIEESTDHLPVGHFWCEWFDGRHYSVDFLFGQQVLVVEGIKADGEFVKWDKWIRRDFMDFELPAELGDIPFKYPWINLEFIGDKLIEVHFRGNPDFSLIEDQKELIPVWKGDIISPPIGY